MDNGYQTNGHASWPVISPELSILLDIQRSVGGIETGQRMMVSAVETLFEDHNDLRDRVTTLEARPTEPHQASRPRPWWRDTGMSVREIISLIAALAIGFTALYQGQPLREVATEAGFYGAGK